MKQKKKIIQSFLIFVLISSCGGGGGGYNNTSKISNATTTATTTNNYGWTPNVFLPASTYKNRCVNPRLEVINPFINQTYLDISGTILDQNHYLRSFSNDTYLWYDQIVDVDPALSTTSEYFNLLKAPHDRFHFSMPSDEWAALAQSGISVGYGATWIFSGTSSERKIFVAYTDPNTPATQPNVNLKRGAEIISIDGVNATSDDTVSLNNGLYPNTTGETHSFIIRDTSTSELRSIEMESSKITSTPVQKVSTISTGSGNLGYMLFNDHIATSEKGLYDAITELKSNNISGLIIDLRYNGGGYLAIASQLAYMIAGPVATAGRSFELTEFNDKYPITDIWGDPITPMPFYTTTIGFSALSQGIPLPTLELSKVFVITSEDTCSASEAIINALQGVDVEVIQIGSTTCGKPYGFYPQDNCSVTYFTIQFKGVNAKGFGDYAYGFSPENEVNSMGVKIKGCFANDDLSYELGNSSETSLTKAINYYLTESCDNPTSLSVSQQKKSKQKIIKKYYIKKSMWHKNRIM